jgi:hypothetical protein
MKKREKIPLFSFEKPASPFLFRKEEAVIGKRSLKRGSESTLMHSEETFLC